MHKNLILTILIFVSAVCHAVGIEECKQMARENYPLIKRYGLIEQTRAFDLTAAAKAWLPQVTVGVQATWQNHVPTYPDALTDMLSQRGVSLDGMRKDQYRAAIDVSQTIWDGGRTKAARNSIRRIADEEALLNSVDLYALDERVEEVCFSIILLRMQQNSIEASLLTIGTNLQVLKSMLTEGVAMQCDVDALECQQLTVVQQLDNVKATLKSFEQVLSLYAGKEVVLSDDWESQIAMQTELANLDLNSRVARPELRLFDAKLSTLDAKQKELDAALMPRLSAFGTAFYGYPGLNTMEAMVNSKWSWNMQVGVRLSWSLSPFYTRKSSLSKLQTARDAVEMQRETFLFNNSLQSTQQSNEIRRLVKIKESDEEILRLRSRVRLAEEAKLREGIINSAQLVEKITDEVNAKINLHTHLVQLQQAVYKYKHTMGKEK